MAKWIDREKYHISKTTVDELQSARCSKCQRLLTTPFMYTFREYDYCPYCGEPMKNEKIYVGDEVITEDGKKYIVISWLRDERIHETDIKLLGKRGSAFWKPKDDVTKTGKHYDAIAAALAELEVDESEEE